MDITTNAVSSQTISSAKSKKLEQDMARALQNIETGSDKQLTAKDLKRIEAASQDFEAMFLTEMLKPMFEGINVNPEFGGGKGEEVFNDFLINEYGKMFAKSGGIGIAEKVREHMIRLQTNTANDPVLAPNLAANSAYQKSQRLAH